MKKPVNLILGTMTFGESVFQPDVGEFANNPIQSLMKESDLP